VPLRSFSQVVAECGRKPSVGDQNQTRHYSERLSAGIARWFGHLLDLKLEGFSVLPPESSVATQYGKKSLDVACLDANKYLALDISVKTFNFKDRKTGNYSHNFTGRFYELLGESLDLRTSYPHAILVAFILLPRDSCLDGNQRRPSSFGKAVRQFSKIAKGASVLDHGLCFDEVFIGLHDELKHLEFFDAKIRPPRTGPPKDDLLQVDDLVNRLVRDVRSSDKERASSKPNVTPGFKWSS